MKTPAKSTKLSSKTLRQRAEAQLKTQTEIKQTIPSDYAAKKMIHELQVHQIELEMQNEELKQARITEKLYYRYTELFEFAPIAYFSFNLKGVVNQVNLRGASLLDIERANLVGKQFSNYLTPQDRDKFNRCLAKAFAGDGIQSFEVLAQIGKHKRWLNIEANLGITETDCLAAVIDITDRKRADEKLKLAANIFTHTLECIIISDENGYIVEANKASCDTTGYSKEELLQSHVSILESSQYEKIETALQKDKSWQGDMSYRTKNGEHHYCWSEMYVIELEEKGTLCRISSFIDLKQSTRVEPKIQFLSKHDPLTGVFNRIALFNRLEQVIARASFNQRMMAVLLVDINGFKAINKQHGHNAGDMALQQIAERLKSCVSEKDTVARFGGDEFVIIIDELLNEQDVADVAQNITAQFERYFDIDHSSAHLSATIGIALYPDDGTDIDTLLGNAEKAMQRGKSHINTTKESDSVTATAPSLKSGKLSAQTTTYYFYTKKLTQYSRQQVKFKEALTQAVAQDQFELYYLPQYDLSKRQIVALEALLCWNHPQRGVLHSDSFISLAEHYGLAVQIGLIMIRKAALQAVIWQKAAINFGRIAINLTEVQLSQFSLIGDLQTILLETKCSIEWLEFEIDEVTFKSDNPTVYENILNISKMGMALTVDKFGADRPLFRLFEQLTIDKFKIAPHFTDGSVNFVNRALQDGFLFLSRSLGVTVVADSLANNTDGEPAIPNKISNEVEPASQQLHSKAMKASEITFHLRCHKRK
ncbi:diguanylate cyclase/phosphodiesterase with PAS/PAC sensor(s) [Psychromonas ingrahamii 37]|uniref:Diguanylate cyclase/phosphodiesterase with PAS/PAC sensor(S) n=1 Tax=Psychromonas ingrahamii (strain DSM 17664 / CCUG 51855 / 37) TaxID=357804 RepID=A1SVV1_PSYIN|nr:diguanylate cyclase [Psychromonas ingrahamii]ABM03616.1 diguanylate cyclase/phosphodiesterase with PAS/PAC sensor(s) [Psychromonas ingrahamii 37]